MEPGVSVEFRDSIAWMTIHGRGDLNLLGLQVFRELNLRLDEVASDQRARVIILQGAGDRAFSAGVDLQEMKALTPLTAEEFIRTLHQATRKLITSPLPAVAAIQGPCLGGALELALACDLRISSDDASFGLPEVRVGLPSVIEASLLPRTIGLGRARALVLTGESVNAHEALGMGLVDQVTPKSRLVEQAANAVQGFMRMSPYVLAVQKDVISKWLEMGEEDAAEYSIKAFALCFATGHPQEAMNAFLEKRPALF